MADNIIIGQINSGRDKGVKIFKNCDCFAVRPLWSLFNRELMFTGDVPVDLRAKGQMDMSKGLEALEKNVEVSDRNVNLVAENSFWMPGIWFFWHRLYNALSGAGGVKKSMRLKYW